MDRVAAGAAPGRSDPSSDSNMLLTNIFRNLGRARQELQECKLRLAQGARARQQNPSFRIPSEDMEEIWGKLDASVVSQLEQLEERLQFLAGIVRERYEAQVRIVGRGGGGGSEGLSDKVKALREKQQATRRRLERIAASMSEQKKLCAGLLAFQAYKSKELTLGEKRYRAKLEEWGCYVTRLQPTIDSLEALTVRMI
jgi:hypothetical protein